MPDPPKRISRWIRPGEMDYRKGAADRLNESFILLRAEAFAGSIYLGGRGAEAALRAVLWKADTDIRQGKKSLDTGHNLHELLINIRSLGLLRAGGPRDPLITAVQHVARLWYNNMRFACSQAVEARWRQIGELEHRRTIKQAATDFYDSCSIIIKRCEVLCQK